MNQVHTTNEHVDEGSQPIAPVRTLFPILDSSVAHSQLRSSWNLLRAIDHGHRVKRYPTLSEMDGDDGD